MAALLSSRQMASFAARGFLRFDKLIPEELNHAFLETAEHILKPAKGMVRYATVFLFLIAPLMSYADAWPKYLSFRLYARRCPIGVILVSDKAAKNLPPDVRP